MTEENKKEELSQDQQIEDLLDGLDAGSEEASTEEDANLDIKSDKEGEESKEEGDVDDDPKPEEDKEDKAGEEAEEEADEEEETGAEEAAEEPGEEEPEEEEDEPSDLETQNRLLLEQIESLQAGKPAEEAKEEIEEIVTSFIGDDEDLDEIISDKGKLNALLLKVQTATQASTTKDILTKIPQIIVSQVQKQKVINDAVEEFYAENEDLKIVKRTVGKVANEVAADNPEWTLDKVFKETGKRTRKLLGMKEDAIAKKKTPKRRPALPKGSGKGRGRVTQDSLTGVEKEVQELVT